jgi:IS30 family transposase
MPRGGLRKDLIACLRHGRPKRRPRSRGQDRRGQISDMLSLHVRPPEVEDRLVQGHWEGDLIKGARNQSAVGTLVERTSRLVLLARMEGATAEAALEPPRHICGARRPVDMWTTRARCPQTHRIKKQKQASI